MHRVSVRQTVALMNEATRKIQQIASFQNHVHDGLPDLVLTEISLRRNASEREFIPFIIYTTLLDMTSHVYKDCTYDWTPVATLHLQI